MANKEALLEQMRKATVIIDHGYREERPGWTTHGGLVDIPGRDPHIMTAGHNVDDNTKAAVVLNPSNGERHTHFFTKYTDDDAPDTAISNIPHARISRDQAGLPAGEKAQQGDLLMVLWTRHIGNGKFAEATMEGISIGSVKDSRDGNMYEGFKVTSGKGDLGDSGTHVVPLIRNGIPQTIAETVGSFRGYLKKEDARNLFPEDDEIAIFSDVPDDVREITRQASGFYDKAA